LFQAGCGGGPTGGAGATNTLEASHSCITCHESKQSKSPGGTGQLIVTEWKASTHNTSNPLNTSKFGAGCTDCHGSGYLHDGVLGQESCAGCHSVGAQAVNPIKNPDRDGKCTKCHDKTNPRANVSDGYNLVSVPGMAAGTTTRFVHFSTGLRTNYVSSNYKQYCRKCHNPHDTIFGREQREQWTESGHGSTRGLARIGLDAKTRGSRITLDQNIGNGNYCVRCHTSTGFINFVKDDKFTDINALPDIGPDGLPDPSGFRSNYPEYKTSSAGVITNSSNTVFKYKDSSREATNCDVCHLDNRVKDTSSYSGTLRKVAVNAGVKIYYPYSSSGTGHFKTVTTVQYDTLGSSNLCLTCHSGRATGQTVREPGMNYLNKPSTPSIHDFAGGAVLQGEKTAFLFYTSPLKYKTFPTHRSINTDGNGPCINCHMPRVPASQSNGTIHSHLFRPVNWTNDDLNDKITGIISYATVCSSCHFESAAEFTNKMNNLREGFRLSVLILQYLRPSSNNWTGQNSNGGLGASGPTYGNNPVPALGGLPAGAYTMGASYNYGFLLNEPSSYNHSPILARQLIYDSIDWLKNGSSNFGNDPASVYDAIKNVPIPTATQNTPTGFPVGTYPAGFLWNKKNPISGAILGITSGPNVVDINYNIFNTEADREKAFSYICKDYVTGSNRCKRW
jgi:hypothetical protein